MGESSRRKFYTEDDSGRIELSFNESSIVEFDLVTGLCVSIKGYEQEDGRFNVIDMCLPGIPAMLPRTARNSC